MFSKIKDILRSGRIKCLHLCAHRLRELRPEGRVVVLAPHPDDEALGCGGFINRMCREGNAPYVVIMTGGGGSLRGHSDMAEEEVIRARRKLTLDSATRLGLPENHITFLDFTDGSIDARPVKEMGRLRRLIEELAPDMLLVPHRGEGWPDHLAVREIGRKLAEEMNIHMYEYCVWMWYYNVWRLDWKNAVCVKFSDKERIAKRLAVDAYIKPLAPCGRPWSGVLPKSFVKANTSDIELYFKCGSLK